MAKRVQCAWTGKQVALAKKHGTPAEFAVAVYKCVPGDISMDEARAAIEKYNTEWDAAGKRTRVTGRAFVSRRPRR